MKIDARRIDAFLADPGSVGVVLLYGDDEGQVRELASGLVRRVAGQLDDPFRVVDLERDAWSGLAAELTSRPLTGGRKVVRVREATDVLTPFVQSCLALQGEGLLVLEARALTGKSKLRALLEKAQNAGVIACYPLDARATGQLVRSVLQADGISVEPDVLEWLPGQLGADQAVSRGEIAKLALYVGPGGIATMEDALACVGDLSGLSVEDAIFAAVQGDVAAADRALELALAEGASPVSVVRQAMMHMQRVLRVLADIQGGSSAEDAVRALRPPLFFRREASFRASLRRWTMKSAEMAVDRLWEAEIGCKRTGSPAETLCRVTLLGLAQRAALAGRGGG